MRPEQWTKNLFVFAGVLFGGRLLDAGAVIRACEVFTIFCALSAAVYLVNDVADRASDRLHPIKRLRPIASGDLQVTTAVWTAAALGAGGLVWGFALSMAVGLSAAAYLTLLLLYSAALKHVVIIDVFTIAAGFVLRAVAGALAVPVPISQWLLVCTTLLALFLALSKRRHELVLLADGATGHRRILEEYSPYLLDQMVAVVTASVFVAYATYATSAETAARLGTNRLALTVPFVLYGIFRYLYLVHHKREGGNPTTVMITDRPLMICVVLWGVSVAALLYTPLGR